MYNEIYLPQEVTEALYKEVIWDFERSLVDGKISNPIELDGGSGYLEAEKVETYKNYCIEYSVGKKDQTINIYFTETNKECNKLIIDGLAPKEDRFILLSVQNKSKNPAKKRNYQIILSRIRNALCHANVEFEDIQMVLKDFLLDNVKTQTMMAKLPKDEFLPLVREIKNKIRLAYTK